MTELWITQRLFTLFAGISRMESYRRVQGGEVISKNREDGRPGKLIYAPSMTRDAQERWRKWLLERADSPKVECSPTQLGLLPRTEVDDQIDALKHPHSQRDVIVRRVRMVQQRLNCNWRAELYPSIGAFEKALAARNGISVRSLQRYVARWKQNEKLEDLADEIPGPMPGTGAVLDADMRMFLQGRYVLDKRKQSQCYRDLAIYLEGKQTSPGCRVAHLYAIPSYSTVKRFLHSLDPIDKAARDGKDKLKAACGHIDRAYRDLHSLERVDTDEWITDVLAFDPGKVSRVGRYYLLTFLDERSMYPLVWSLVEHPNEQEEINLLCRLIREFGVPGLINSDRGRFRWPTFGGKFISGDRSEINRKRDGILDRLGIARNLPREHNPRGSRLERFHLELANWARTVTGWCGSDTKQRRMTDADERASQHKEWTRTGQGKPPLLSRDQLLEHLNQFMEDFRKRPSNGNDMDGFTPEAVFQQNTPAGGFRHISDGELAWHTAEHFEVLIRKGGIIQLRDGKRYSDPVLILIQGQHREVARARHDHDQISVLPAAKGEEAIIAKRRARVGANDSDELARQMELQTRLRKLTGAMVQPLEYDPGFFYRDEAPRATQVIHPEEFIAAQQAPPPVPENEISSVEFLMEHDRYKRRVKPMDFADLEG